MKVRREGELPYCLAVVVCLVILVLAVACLIFLIAAYIMSAF